MRLDYFKYRMKNDRTFWDITKDITLFVEKRNVELYDIRTDEARQFKTIDEVLDIEVEGKKIRTYIEEMDDLPPLIFDDSNIKIN